MPAHLPRRALLPLPLACLVLPSAGCADRPRSVRIGILNDQDGPFADQSGRGGLVAAQLAAEDFAKEDPFIAVEIVYDDRQNKPGLARQVVSKWIESEDVDAVAGVPSSVAPAISDLARKRNKTLLVTGVGAGNLTGQYCAPTTVRWALATSALGNSAAQALAQRGPVYFISYGHALSRALVQDTTDALKRLGGSVAGVAEHPLGATDFSSYLLQARTSGAKVIAFADRGTNFVNAVKQAYASGASSGATLAGLFTEIADVDALGLPAAQGLIVTAAFYWDLNDQTRSFAKRFTNMVPGWIPTESQAGVYSGVLAYLRAVRATHSRDGDKVVAAMKAHPIPDTVLGTVTVRPDGQAIHPMHVFRVKHPAESRGRWDYYSPISTIPAEQAFQPTEGDGCATPR